jgi:hypothetical protein
METQIDRQTKIALIRDNDTASGFRRTFATPGVEASAAVLTRQLRRDFEKFVEMAEYLDLYLLMEILQILEAIGDEGNLVDAFASVLDITLPSCGSTAPGEASMEASN